MPGPPKTPTGLLNIRGSWRGKQRQDEPEGPPGRPPMPPHLSPKAKTAWKRLILILDEMGILTLADGFALERYCRLYSRWRDAEHEVKKQGQLIYVWTREGEKVPRKNPYVSIAREISSELLRLERQFGLTPAARANLVVRTPTGGKESGGKSHLFKKKRA